jgi:hypothetical protein
MWLAMQALWLLYTLCYKMASLATVKATSAHQRIDSLVGAVAPAVNLQANGGNIGGDTHIAGTLYGSGGVLPVGDTIDGTIDLGNGALSSLFTGSVSVPGSIGTYNASATMTLAQIQAFMGTTGAGGNYWNLIASTIDSLITTVAYIQSELSAHKFSST